MFVYGECVVIWMKLKRIYSQTNVAAPLSRTKRFRQCN